MCVNTFSRTKKGNIIKHLTLNICVKLTLQTLLYKYVMYFILVIHIISFIECKLNWNTTHVNDEIPGLNFSIGGPLLQVSAECKHFRKTRSRLAGGWRGIDRRHLLGVVSLTCGKYQMFDVGGVAWIHSHKVLHAELGPALWALLDQRGLALDVQWPVGVGALGQHHKTVANVVVVHFVRPTHDDLVSAVYYFATSSSSSHCRCRLSDGSPIFTDIWNLTYFCFNVIIEL